MGVGDSRQNEVLIKNSSINIIPSTVPTIFKSLCKIECGNSISSGFLIKLFKRTKDFFCLMTNEHVITKEMIKKRRTITLYYDNEIEPKPKKSLFFITISLIILTFLAIIMMK